VFDGGRGHTRLKEIRSGPGRRGGKQRQSVEMTKGEAESPAKKRKKAGGKEKGKNRWGKGEERPSPLS